jgi:hypothetical protein
MNFGAFAVAGAVTASTGMVHLWVREHGLCDENLFFSSE